MKIAVIIIFTTLLILIEADRPIFFLKCSSGDNNRARNVCNNQCYATNCMSKFKNKNRIYSYNNDKTDDNRKSSGCDAKPCGKNSKLTDLGAGENMQCDEFPQASWNEGGFGSSLRCVPSKENNSQGGQFRKFLREHNLQRNDEFSINWLWNGNEPELDFCLRKNCKNDGKQFHYVNRQFETLEESEKSALDDGYYMTEGSPNDEGLQAFKTDTNMVLVNPNGNGIINSTIYTYNDDGTKEPHVIVQQIQ